jgi:ketopantoate reductase
MSQAVSGALRISDWEISQSVPLMDVAMALGRECLQVGIALGYQIEPIIGMTAEEMLGASDDVLRRTLLRLYSHIGQKSINSFLQDLIKGRPTEVHHMNGLVARKGRAAGVPTPLNEKITAMIQEIEAGRLGLGAENLGRVENLVPERRAAAGR